MVKGLTKDTVLLPNIPLKTAQKDSSIKPKYRRRFHVMAKPGGAKCNIDCKYCFYLHKEKLLHQPIQPKMDYALLEKYIADYINSQDNQNIVFSWQGGEPTLLGIDYFRKIMFFQEKHKPTGKNIYNDLQTNGVLINDEWCEFLSDNNFLVGLSIDGPEKIHDYYRMLVK